jgi:hypothetical protein
MDSQERLYSALITWFLLTAVDLSVIYSKTFVFVSQTVTQFVLVLSEKNAV